MLIQSLPSPNSCIGPGFQYLSYNSHSFYIKFFVLRKTAESKLTNSDGIINEFLPNIELSLDFINDINGTPPTFQSLGLPVNPLAVVTRPVNLFLIKTPAVKPYVEARLQSNNDGVDPLP